MHKKQSCNHAALPYLGQVQALFSTVLTELYNYPRAEAKIGHPFLAASQRVHHMREWTEWNSLL